MRKVFFFCYILSVVIAFWGCSSDNEDSSSSDCLWKTSLVASKIGGEIETVEENDSYDDELTRSLFIGGQTGTRFTKLWDQYDVAQVYKDGTNVGTLTPLEIGALKSKLTGTLEGSYQVGDELTLYMPSPDLDYTGQDGTIGNMSRYFDFMMATVKVASVEGSTITTEDLSFKPRQSYLLLKFKDENSLKLHVKQVVIHAANGKLVASQSNGGTPVYTDELIINTVKESSTEDYPSDIYVALFNDEKKKTSYTVTVLATDGKTYKTKSAMSVYFGSTGSLTTATRATICSTVDVEVQTAITPPESDEPDVQQVTL